MTEFEISDIAEEIKKLGTEDDLELYDFEGRYRYLSDLTELSIDIHRAIDRTIKTLTKWNEEYYQHGNKLDKISDLINQEKEGQITPAVLNQLMRRLFEVSQG